jgi:hypothetical protein
VLLDSSVLPLSVSRDSGLQLLLQASVLQLYAARIAALLALLVFRESLLQLLHLFVTPDYVLQLS